MTATASPDLAADVAEVERHIRAHHEPGAVFELRALDVSTPAYRRPHTVSGYYDDPSAAAKDAAGLSPNAGGVYLTLHPIKPALLARAANRCRPVDKEPTTSDPDATARRWLLIDLDPKRPSGISATDEERDLAKERAREVYRFMRTLGFPEPIAGDSGNGSHLLYRVDLPADDGGLTKRCLEALALKFDDERVTVDTTVFNPARITKLYGTLARKGDHTADRPHRRAHLLRVPEVMEVATREVVQTLAAMAPATPQLPERRHGGGSFDIDAWIREHIPSASGPFPYAGAGRKWVPPVCPWDASHTNRSAYVIQLPSGALSAGCQHNSCSGRDWHALRDQLEPGWREQREAAAAERVAVSAAPLVTRAIVTNRATGTGEEESAAWQPPVPFHRFSLPPFPVEVFPDWLRRYVEALSEALQVPADLNALMSLAVLATVSARKVAVRVRADWTEPMNLYVVVILDSGNRKSPAVSAVCEPLNDWEEEQTRLRGPDVAEAQTRRKILEASLAQAEAAASKGAPDDRELRTTEAVNLSRELARTSVPVVPRLLADETTPERLATLIRDHDGRMAVITAEGGDVFDIMVGRYSNGPNLGPFLKGHAGDTLRIDRVGRQPEYVRDPALTLGLPVQREVIRGLASTPTLRGRGVLARPLYSFPASLLGRRNEDPEPMPEAVRADYRANVLALLGVPWQEDQYGQRVPWLLNLSDEATGELQHFMAQLEPHLGDYGDLANLTDWGGKLAGSVVRLAGLLHMAAHVRHEAPWRLPINGDTLRAAAKVAEYLIPHARATFAEMGTDADVEGARRILGWIEKHEHESFTKRDVFEGTKGHFKKVEALAAPLRVLLDHGYIREREDDTPPGRAGRKPSPTYDVNPHVLGSSANTANTALIGGAVSAAVRQTRVF